MTTEPFVPIPEDVIPKMLELASVKANETVVDLEYGDGRIVITTAKQFSAIAIGVEVREKLVKESRLKTKESRLSDVCVLEMDKRISDLQSSMDSTNRTINLQQRNVENHRQSIAADQTEMERSMPKLSASTT